MKIGGPEYLSKKQFIVYKFPKERVMHQIILFGNTIQDKSLTTAFAIFAPYPCTSNQLANTRG